MVTDASTSIVTFWAPASIRQSDCWVILAARAVFSNGYHAIRFCLSPVAMVLRKLTIFPSKLNLRASELRHTKMYV